MAEVYEIGDIVTLKKGHPCGSKDWGDLASGRRFPPEVHGMWASDHGSP